MSFDSQEKNRAFSEKFSFGYPLLCDTNHEMGVAYGAATDETQRTAKRIGVVIDEEGKILEVEPSVHAKSYPRDVLARL